MLVDSSVVIFFRRSLDGPRALDKPPPGFASEKPTVKTMMDVEKCVLYSLLLFFSAYGWNMGNNNFQKNITTCPTMFLEL